MTVLSRSREISNFQWLERRRRKQLVQRRQRLGETKGLEPYSAYMICSCAGDLKISEIVDQPKWVVSFHMPLAIFGTLPMLRN